MSLSRDRASGPWAYVCPACYAAKSQVYRRTGSLGYRFPKKPRYHCRACKTDFEVLAHASERPSSRPAWY